MDPSQTEMQRRLCSSASYIMHCHYTGFAHCMHTIPITIRITITIPNAKWVGTHCSLQYTGAHTAVWVAMKHHVFISPCISTTKYGISYSKMAIACSTTLAIIVYHAVYVSWYITGLQCLYNMGLSDWHTGSIYLYLSSVLSTHAPANMQQKRYRRWYWFSRAVACIMKLFVWSTKSLSTYNARRQHLFDYISLYSVQLV